MVQPRREKKEREGNSGREPREEADCVAGDGGAAPWSGPCGDRGFDQTGQIASHLDRWRAVCLFTGRPQFRAAEAGTEEEESMS